MKCLLAWLETEQEEEGITALNGSLIPKLLRKIETKHADAYGYLIRIS